MHSVFSLNQYFDHVFVINMDKDRQRMEHAQKQLQAYHTTFSRFPGLVVDKSIRQSEADALCRYFCTDGMLGCFLSHKQLWERVVKNKWANALILEDDFVIAKHITTTLPAALEKIPADWDILYLGCLSCDAYTVLDMGLNALIYGQPMPPEFKQDGFKTQYTAIGTEAYAISYACAVRLTQKYNKIVTQHVDYALSSNARLVKYSIQPPVMYQNYKGFHLNSNTSSKSPILLNTWTSNIRLSSSPYDGRTLGWKLSVPVFQVTKYAPMNTWVLVFMVIGYLHLQVAFVILTLDLGYSTWTQSDPLTVLTYVHYYVAASIGHLVRKAAFGKKKSRVNP